MNKRDFLRGVKETSCGHCGGKLEAKDYKGMSLIAIKCNSCDFAYVVDGDIKLKWRNKDPKSIKLSLGDIK